MVSGEVPKFTAGIGGVAQQWTTKLIRVDKVDGEDVLAETNLNIRLLNKDAESGRRFFVYQKSAMTGK